MAGEHSRSGSRLSRRQRHVAIALAVVCIVLTSAALVSAQQTFSDDFEDGDVDGWEGQGMDVNSTSVEGEWSLRGLDGVPDASDFPRWVDGPTIDLEEEFTITGTSNSDQGTGTPARTGFGLINDTGQGAMLLFSKEFDSTFLASDGNGEFSESLDHYDTDFNVTWVEWEVHSPGNGTLQAKVWEHGTTEPSSYDLQRDFGGGAGAMTVWTGTTEEARTVFLDSVQITGEQAPETSEDLDLDVPKYMQHNQTHHYTVEANQSGTWVDVTEDANVTPANPEAVTLYPSNGTIHSTNNSTINVQFNVTAQYGGLNDSEEMTVAAPTIKNLHLLPTWWKVNATVGDGGMLWLIVATLAAVVATRAANAFAGVGGYTMIMIGGWMTGPVPGSVMLATIVMGLFLGLNLAANVDTSVRGSG